MVRRRLVRAHVRTSMLVWTVLPLRHPYATPPARESLACGAAAEKNLLASNYRHVYTIG